MVQWTEPSGVGLGSTTDIQRLKLKSLSSAFALAHVFKEEFPFIGGENKKFDSPSSAKPLMTNSLQLEYNRGELRRTTACQCLNKVATIRKKSQRR